MKKRKGSSGCINKCTYDMIYIKYTHNKSATKKLKGKLIPFLLLLTKILGV